MGGMQPGDKLTAQNLNDAYMCRTDDTDSTGRIKTDRYLVQGKRDEVAADAQTLVADVGAILLTAPGAPTGSEGASTLSPDPTQGAENGQILNILNCSGGNYSLDFLADPVTIPDGLGTSLIYCSTKSNWVPIGGTGSGGASCKTIQSAPPAGTAVGTHVYYDGAAWQIGTNASADTVGTFYVVEFSANDFKIQMSGFLEQTGHGFTPGEYYFIDDAGGYTATKPVGAGEVKKDAFFAVDADCLYLLMDNPVVVIEEFGGIATAQIEPLLYRSNSGQAFPHSVDTDMAFNVPVLTTPDILVNGAGSTFTVQKDGVYDIKGKFALANTGGMQNTIQIELDIHINGSATFGGIHGDSFTATGNQQGAHSAEVSGTLPLVVGDVITIVGKHFNTGGGARALLTSLIFNSVNIHRIPEEPV